MTKNIVYLRELEAELERASKEYRIKKEALELEISKVRKELYIGSGVNGNEI